MPAAPAAVDSRSCPSRNLRVLAAALAVWFLGIGGSYQVHLLRPELAALTAACLGALAVAGLWRAARQGVAWPLAVALVLGLWTVATAPCALWPRGAAEAGWWALAGPGLACLVAAAGDHPETGYALTDAFLFAALVVLLVGLAQGLGWIEPDARHVTEDGHLRIVATLNHPNNLAGFVALMLPIAAGTAWSGHRTGRPAAASLGAAVATAGLACAALTYSKGGQLAVLVGLAAFAAAAPPTGWRGWLRDGGPRARRAVGLAAVGLTAAAVALWFSPLGSRLRLFVDLLPTLRDFRRWGTYATAGRMVAEQPWTGCGAGCFGVAFPLHKGAAEHHELYSHAHSWPLNQAAETGLPGLLLLLAALAGALLLAWRSRGPAVPGRRRGVGLFAGLVGFVTSGLLDYGLGVPALSMSFWFVFGLASRGGTPRRFGLVTVPALCALIALTPPLLLWQRGNAAYLAALGAVQRGDLDAAATRLELARALDPGQPAYAALRADLALWRGHPRAARAFLEQLAAAHRPPLNSWHRARLAALQAGDGDLAVAEATREAAARDDPAEPGLLVELGLLTHSPDRLRAALERWPDCGAAHIGLSRPGDGAPLEALAAGLPRDRIPRFMLRYGRVDPTVALPPARQGLLLPWRSEFDGPLLPRLRAVELEAGLLSRGPSPPE